MLDTETTTTADSARHGRSPWKIILVGIAVFVVGVGAALAWFFGGDAPNEVDLDATADAVTGDVATGDSTPSATGIEGIWVVDTSVGAFTVEEETTATFAGFRVEEVLQSIGSTTAVGRAPGVSGSIEIDSTTLIAAEIDVDLTSMVSDEPRREDKIQEALGTGSNPEATFVLAEPIELGEGAAAGELVTATATGELTLNGVTNLIDIPLEAQLVDGMILITGSTDISFADYGVTVPSAPVVLSVEDDGILEFQLWLGAA